MGIGQDTLRLLKRLAAELAVEPKPLTKSDLDITKGMRSGRIPSNIAPDNSDSQELFLLGAERALYKEAIRSLASEPDFEHLTESDIDTELWFFACDIAVNWTAYRDTGARNQRINSFISDVSRELKDFEVLFVVEHLQIPEETLAIAGVDFFHLDAVKATEWGIIDRQGQVGTAQDFVGQTVGLVRVQAGSPAKAIEQAANTFDTALNVLRVCVASGKVATGFFAPISDFELLQRRGQVYAVKEMGATNIARAGWQLGFREVSRELRAELLESTRIASERFAPIFDGSLPPDLSPRLLRALEWIGTSITREHYDDKVIDLCTALEAILAKKSDVKKAEVIATRSVLLAMSIESAFSDPAMLYNLYGLRSSVVHGSARGLCHEGHYIALRHATLQVMLQAIEFLSRNQSIRTISEFHTVLEEVQHLQGFTRVIEQSKGQEARALRKYLGTLLETKGQLNANTHKSDAQVYNSE